MIKSIKSRKHTFKNLHNFVQSLTYKPIGDKLLVFSDIKLLHVCILSQKSRVCQKPGGSATPGTDNARKINAKQLPGGMGAAGIDWSMHTVTLSKIEVTT